MCTNSLSWNSLSHSKLETPDMNTAEIQEHFLFPATLFVSDRPFRVQTILGSCVSVCLYDEVLRYGGINHYMLPEWNHENAQCSKYGDTAIIGLIEKMIQLGCQQRNLVAKIFGGSDQLTDGSSGYKIGSKNIAVAEKILSAKGIPLLAKSTGGMFGRKIIFCTNKNQVMVKFLRSEN